MKERKMVIAPVFKKWLKTASKEEKQKMCDDVNALATSLRVASRSAER